MNKTLIIIAIVSTIFSIACNSTKLANKGNYDDALRIAVRKLQKNKNDATQIATLANAYPAAMGNDKQRIESISRSTSPDKYDQMISIYKTMKERQELVKTVLPLKNGSETIDFKTVDYDKQMQMTRVNAGKFHWNSALNYYSSKTKHGYYQAYQSLETAQYYLGKPDSLINFMNKCVEEGCYKIILSLTSYTSKISARVLYDVAKEACANSGSQWFRYYTTTSIGKMVPDFKINCTIDNIIIGLNTDENSNRHFDMEIDNGSEYVRDSHGQIKRDSTGRYISRKKISTYSCDYFETSQLKRAEMIVTLKYYNTNSSRILFQSEPTSIVYDFENKFARVKGDIEAVPRELRPYLSNSPVQYPTNSEMIAQLCRTLRDALPDMVSKNEDYIISEY